MGRFLNIVSRDVEHWPHTQRLRISFYAIRPGVDNSGPSRALCTAIKRWHAQHCNGRLDVQVRQFVGQMLTYDDDTHLGLVRASRGGYAQVRYDILSLVGGKVRIECPANKAELATFDIGQNRVVESIAGKLEDISQHPSRAQSSCFQKLVFDNGCETCRRLLSSFKVK